MPLTLVIGNKNYSTWSLRPWLLLDGFNVAFDEQWVSLRSEGLSDRLRRYSDSARVPVLIDGDLHIWDSLAICEYLNDNYLNGRGWPQNIREKAIARSIVSEMHSGFSALRTEMPMNCRASRLVSMSEACAADVGRIEEIWSAYATPDSQGQLRLFGEFSIADCFFAPVVMRFATYQPVLSEFSLSYMRDIKRHSSMQKWLSSALLETEIIDEDEAGIDR